VGILIPTVGFVRNSASEARQKVQFAAIDMAIMAFKMDEQTRVGDYPLSTLDMSLGTGKYYCGAQKLCEALVGWDLLGFNPNSVWRSDGKDSSGNIVYSSTDANLAARVGPYLELGTTNAFTLRQLFGSSTSTDLSIDRYVLCDSFGAKPVTVVAGGKTVKAGRPILYYKANTVNKKFGPLSGETDPTKWIYNYIDNIDLINLKKNSEKSNDKLAEADPTGTGNPLGTYLYSYQYKLKDPKIAWPLIWPYRPDSYILISAGADGLYGTQDDVCNF
jgi:hypothetical protein